MGCVYSVPREPSTEVCKVPAGHCTQCAANNSAKSGPQQPQVCVPIPHAAPELLAFNVSVGSCCGQRAMRCSLTPAALLDHQEPAPQQQGQLADGSQSSSLMVLWREPEKPADEQERFESLASYNILDTVWAQTPSTRTAAPRIPNLSMRCASAYSTQVPSASISACILQPKQHCKFG